MNLGAMQRMLIQDCIACQYEFGYGVLRDDYSGDNAEMYKKEPPQPDPSRPYAVLLKRLMAEHKLSDNGLAKKATVTTKKVVTQATVTRLRHGETAEPRESSIGPIAEYFGITSEDFRAGRHPDDKAKQPIRHQDQNRGLSRKALALAKVWQELTPLNQEIVAVMVKQLKRGEVVKKRRPIDSGDDQSSS